MPTVISVSKLSNFHRYFKFTKKLCNKAYHIIKKQYTVNEHLKEQAKKEIREAETGSRGSRPLRGMGQSPIRNQAAHRQTYRLAELFARLVSSFVRCERSERAVCGFSTFFTVGQVIALQGRGRFDPDLEVSACPAHSLHENRCALSCNKIGNSLVFARFCRFIILLVFVRFS